MTLLVVDVGNTSTAVGLWKDGRVTRIRHCDDGFSAASRVARVLGRNAAGLAYLSVVPAADAPWRRFAERVLHLPFHRIDWRLSPLALDYPKPETIGADRLADAVGAVERYGAPVIVCDFGTAFTAAAVTEDRVWRGGVIAPGFPLVRDYFFERTAKLPRLALPSRARLAAGRGWRVPKIGRSTEEAMRFGALVGFRGMAREIVTRLRANFDTDFKLVATGGFARWALAGIDLPFTIDPDLTLFGAGLIVARNGAEETLPSHARHRKKSL